MITNRIRQRSSTRNLPAWRWLLRIILVTGSAICLSLYAVPASLLQADLPTEGAYLQGGATTITLQPSTATIQGCETIQVEIWINDVADLYGADVRLSFDPAVLEVVDADADPLNGVQVENGGFLVPPLYTVLNEADNTAGTIKYAATQLNPTPAANGSGVLAIIRFKAKATGSSDLHFTYTKLANRDGTEISATPTDGSITAIATISIAGASTIQGCETSQVEIWINNVADLYGADVRLSFDPAVLEVVDADAGEPGIQIENGGFLVPPLYTALNEADNAAGTIKYAATQLNPTPPANGCGILAIVTFRAKTAGSSDLDFTYTKLADRDGNTLPATPADGSVSTVAPSTPTLSIARLNSTTARLSWTASAGVAEYRLYRDTTPYFTPTDTPHHATSNLSYDDAGALGNTATNYYYVIKSACDHGFKSAASNRVGEYDYALASASTANYNDIAFVLDVPSVNDAASLAEYIGSSVKRVAHYNAETQSFQTYIVGNPATNFGLSIGEFAFVVTDNTAPSSVALVGGVPDPGSVSCPLVCDHPAKYNSFSLPLDHGNLTCACEVENDVGAGVTRVARYRTETQSYQTYIPGNSATDFPLVIGEPFVLVLSPGAPANWP